MSAPKVRTCSFADRVEVAMRVDLDGAVSIVVGERFDEAKCAELVEHIQTHNRGPAHYACGGRIHDSWRLKEDPDQGPLPQQLELAADLDRFSTNLNVLRTHGCATDAAWLEEHMDALREHILGRGDEDLGAKAADIFDRCATTLRAIVDGDLVMVDLTEPYNDEAGNLITRVPVSARLLLNEA